MAKVRCDKVTDGFRDSEGVAQVVDYSGRRHFIRVERDFLDTEADGVYLPIGVVSVNTKQNVVLIELPHEAETGANRLWVRPDQLNEPVEALT